MLKEESNPESNLGAATERAATKLEELRLRLNTETPREAESLDALERELQAYFSTASRRSPGGGGLLNEIRDRVVEGVVDRIMRAWEEPLEQGSGATSSALKDDVLQRLIERVFERLENESGGSTDPTRSESRGI
jgi:hypothetical protein